MQPSGPSFISVSSVDSYDSPTSRTSSCLSSYYSEDDWEAEEDFSSASGGSNEEDIMEYRLRLSAEAHRRAVKKMHSLKCNHRTVMPLGERCIIDGGAVDFQKIPKTKEGYLHKKGGKKSQKPWQKRWFVFNGEELKYFTDKNYKESDALNRIKLRDMIYIKPANGGGEKQQQQHKFEFDLVVAERVFKLYAESREECEGWVAVLNAAINKFKPEEDEENFREGGSLHDPDKQGSLLKQGRGMGRGFKERYIALKGSKFAYYENREAFVKGCPIHILELALANVRPDTSGKHRFIITMNNQKTYTFQAANDLERGEWLEKITTAILAGLVGGEKDPVPPTKSEPSFQDIIAKIQENPANKVCADCVSPDPSWGVCNRGIMVCIECSGVHRAMGAHISKVRSVELDKSIWTDNLIKLMVNIGNTSSNLFWEKHFSGQERLEADSERSIRESFIRAKYEMKSWIPRTTASREVLSQQLCNAVAGDNLMQTVELIVQGAEVCYMLPGETNSDLQTVLGIAKHYKKDLQVELLEQNGALTCQMQKQRMDVPAVVSKRGYLYKTGSDRTGWKRRWCILDQFRGLEYFKSETDLDLCGCIKVHEMLSVSQCDEESNKDIKRSHCFEINTQSRGYLFAADSKKEMDNWIETLEKVMPHDGAEKLGFDRVGYLRKKDPHNVGGWKRRWFTLKGKSLVYYGREREELATIDLKKVTKLKPPDPNGPPELQCSFQILLPERVYHLKADNVQDAEAWFASLKQTQVSGIPLEKQQLTAGGIPIIVHKCLQFVETFGIEVEGLYRKSGEKSKIRKLILAFNQDAHGVVIDKEAYNVHDVTGTLKQFLKSLPDPILTHRLYDPFISAMRQGNGKQQIDIMQSLVEQLPTVNKETLKRLIGHLRKIIDHEDKNKMTKKNLISLFGPTLMTVDDDSASYADSPHQYMCIGKMIDNYKWLFQVDQEEEAREKEIEEAKQRLMKAAVSHNTQRQVVGMSSKMNFLQTFYIGNKEGDSCGTYITPTTLVGEVVEEVVTTKSLPPDSYALFLVLGDSESHRVLHSSDRLLGVLSSVGSECFLCVKPNTFAAMLQPHMAEDTWQSVQVQVREKRKWRKYPCAVRGKDFIQYKDNKCAHEISRMPVTDFDVFAGMEAGVKTDHKNPMPTRHALWLKPTRGMDDHAKYLCADSEADMLRLMAAIIKAKYGEEGLQTPVMPSKQLPPEVTLRRFTTSSPRASPKVSPSVPRRNGGSFQVPSAAKT